MTYVWALFWVIWVAVIYVWILRPIFSRMPALAGVYRMLDQYEAPMFARVRVTMSGLKRKVFSRLVYVSGFMLSIHELVLPHLTTIEPIIPEKYRGMLLPVMTIMGLVFEYLSKISPTPMDEVNPGVLAAVTETSIVEVARETIADPVVAIPVQEQITADTLQV